MKAMPLRCRTCHLIFSYLLLPIPHSLRWTWFSPMSTGWQKNTFLLQAYSPRPGRPTSGCTHCCHPLTRHYDWGTCHCELLWLKNTQSSASPPRAFETLKTKPHLQVEFHGCLQVLTLGCQLGQVLVCGILQYQPRVFQTLFLVTG